MWYVLTKQKKLGIAVILNHILKKSKNIKLLYSLIYKIKGINILYSIAKCSYGLKSVLGIKPFIMAIIN